MNELLFFAIKTLDQAKKIKDIELKGRVGKAGDRKKVVWTPQINPSAAFADCI